MNSIPAHFTTGVLKRFFRGVLPVFARYWYDARESAPPDSLNALYWPDYVRVLRACQDVLDRAPMHPNEAKQCNIETRYNYALERLATALSEVFDGRLQELEGYIVTDQVREMRRQEGLRRYRREQGYARRRRRRR